MAAISSQELVDPVPRTGFDVWVIEYALSFLDGVTFSHLRSSSVYPSLE